MNGLGLVSTENSARIWGALTELEQRLTDPEILGIGLVFGYPGRGKTITAEEYHTRRSAEGVIRTYWCPAAPTWRTQTAMIGDLVEAVGAREVSRRSAHARLKGLTGYLRSYPGIVIIDEIDYFVGHRDQIHVIKHLHDLTSCGFLLIGEPSCRRRLNNYVSVASRLNEDAVVEVETHSLQDVANVTRFRCGIPVDDDVCVSIHRKYRESMRLVVKKCRQLRVLANASGLDRLTSEHLRVVEDEAAQPKPVPALPLAAVGGSHGH